MLDIDRYAVRQLEKAGVLMPCMRTANHHRRWRRDEVRRLKNSRSNQHEIRIANVFRKERAEVIVKVVQDMVNQALQGKTMTRFVIGFVHA